MHARSWSENLKERNCLKDLGVEETVTLKLIFMKQDAMTWTELLWLRIGTNGRLL
jgi:hypothetical protein